MSCTNTDPVEIHECQEGGIRGDPDKDVIVSTPPPPRHRLHIMGIQTAVKPLYLTQVVRLPIRPLSGHQGTICGEAVSGTSQRFPNLLLCSLLDGSDLM